MFARRFSNSIFTTRRSHRQRISPSPESQPIAAPERSSSFEIPISSQPFSIIDPKLNQLISTALSSNTIEFNSLSDRSKMLNSHPIQKQVSIDETHIHLSASLNNIHEENDSNSPPSESVLKSNLSSSDLDPFERKKQIILAKAEAKLDKAQNLYQLAQHSVEQTISEFLRATTMPGIGNESSSSKTIIASFEKRIRTLQETKKKLEKKISNYQIDITRIQSGDIPHHYRSSKDILNNIKNKVSNGNYKNRSFTVVSTPIASDQTLSSMNVESDSFHTQLSLPGTGVNHTVDSNTTIPATNATNQTLLTYSQNSNTLDIMRSSPSGSISNEVGNSQFYIDSNYESVYDSDKSNRKSDAIIPSDMSMIHDSDRSPLGKRRLTEESNFDFNDQISDNSNDDRLFSSMSSKRNTITTTEYHQMMVKFDTVQKTIERYETKMNDMQKQIETLTSTNESQNERNERLSKTLADFTDTHQKEMSTMKNELKTMEDRVLYRVNEYLAEVVERLDKLDTRTSKVEQTQAHALETEEHTHRLISKLVNILLTIFAIILLLLSTIKNLLQSRVHAIILLILVFTWIFIRYVPENYFQLSFYKNFTNVF